MRRGSPIDANQLAARLDRRLDGERVLTVALTRVGSESTAIVCERSHEVEAALRERRIIASARGPVIRIAPHFYNSPDDVDHALDALDIEVRKRA